MFCDRDLCYVTDYRQVTVEKLWRGSYGKADFNKTQQLKHVALY